MSDDLQITPRTRTAGQLPFVAGFLAVSLLLLALIGVQTRWIEGTDTVAQPRFWPAVGLGAMAGFSALHLWRMKRRRLAREDRAELRRWAAPLEYALWFMAYVWAVPAIGFLPASLVFAPALTWRAGYRDRAMLAAAAAFAVATVIVFKSLLGVRIPGGALYELLPGALRSFAILNL